MAFWNYLPYIWLHKRERESVSIYNAVLSSLLPKFHYFRVRLQGWIVVWWINFYYNGLISTLFQAICCALIMVLIVHMLNQSSSFTAICIDRIHLTITSVKFWLEVFWSKVNVNGFGEESVWLASFGIVVVLLLAFYDTERFKRHFLSFRKKSLRNSLMLVFIFIIVFVTLLLFYTL